jgi:type IV pilus assembly protein PilA
MRLAPRPSFALLLRIPGQAGRLTGQHAGRYRGVQLVKVFAAPGTGGMVVAAALPEGVVLGSVDGVESAIDLSKRKTAALDPKAALGDALELDGKAVDALIALNASALPQMAPTAQRFGVGVAAMTLDRKGGLVLRVTGDPDKLQMALGFIRASLSAALSGLEQKMNKAIQGNDVPAGVVSIVSFYQARELIAELDPKFDGAGLVSRYGLPEVDLSAGLVAYAGVLAAVAIPAFIKYIRRSKTVEATESLDKIKAGLKAHYVGNGKRRRNRYRFPRSTPWTPAVTCCKGTSSPKCTPAAKSFDHPTWRAVRFQLTDPHYYQYRITSEGRGKKAQVTVEAQGDLDCDGVLSNYKIIGSFEDNGDLVFKGPIIVNEIE